MNIVIIKSNLKKGLFSVERGIGENLNLPILKNVLIESQNNKVKLITTNLEIAVSFFVTGKIIDNGKVCVPINVLSSLVTNLSTERLNLEKKGNNLILKSDNYKATINGLPTEDFPLIPKIKNLGEYIEIKAEIFKEALNQVIIATQYSDLRPELNSILFDFSIDNLKLVTTDSFRLAERTIIAESQFQSNYKKEFKTLIPLKTAQEILKILEDDETLKIYYDQSQILFKTEQLEFISRITEGNFPDYGSIIPKKFGAEFILKKEEFINALKLASVFGGRNNEVKLLISSDTKSLEVASTDQIIGENNYSMSAKIQGKLKNKEIIFNWKYLMDVLKILESEEIFLGVNDNNEPSLIRDFLNKHYFYILKPIVKE